MEQALADILVFVTAAVVSFLLDFFPKLNEWFAAKTKTQKRGIVAILMVVVAGAFYGLACSGALNMVSPELGLTCDQNGLGLLLRAFVVAIGASQLTHWTLPK